MQIVGLLESVVKRANDATYEYLTTLSERKEKRVALRKLVSLTLRYFVVPTMHSNVELDYKLNKFLLTIVGAWPYQSTKSKAICWIFMTLFWITFIVPLISKVVIVEGEWDTTTDILIELLLASVCSTVFVFSINSFETLKDIVERMNADLRAQKLKKEMEIMQRNTDSTKFIVLAYTYYIYTITLLFLLIPLLPALLDLVTPLNDTRPRKQLIESEYFVDKNEYFYVIFFHISSTVLLGVTLVVGVDSMYVVLVRHACTMFSITSYRLENYLYNRKTVHSTTAKMLTYDHDIAKCINIHKNAMQFASMIESYYTWSFLIQYGLAIASLSITLLRVAAVQNRMDDIIRYVGIALAQLMRLFFNSYPAQILMDHSIQIRDSVYKGEWYDIPVRSQKLLLLIIRRSSEPSILTAGKICVISLSSFMAIVQTSVSYFTVLSTV